MANHSEPVSEVRRLRRLQIAVPIVIAAYLVVVEVWSRLFFSGNAPGPYKLLSFHVHNSRYIVLLLLLSAIILLVKVLKIRRQARRMSWQPLIGAGLMLLVSAMLCGWSVTGEISGDSAATIGTLTYYLVENSSQNSGFSDLMLVKCENDGLACRAFRYTQIKSQDSAYLGISPSGETAVIVCVRLSGRCSVAAPMPQP